MRRVSAVRPLVGVGLQEMSSTVRPVKIVHEKTSLVHGCNTLALANVINETNVKFMLKLKCDTKT